jgi:hypothetical protein
MPKGKASTIALSGEERRELESLARRRKTGQALALRARIVLAAAEGGDNGQIAERLRVFRGTVGTWRERFARDRLDGLHDEPRPGAPRQIPDCFGALTGSIVSRAADAAARAAFCRGIELPLGWCGGLLPTLENASASQILTLASAAPAPPSSV